MALIDKLYPMRVWKCTIFCWVSIFSKNVTFWQLSIKFTSVNKSTKTDVVMGMYGYSWAIIVPNMKWIALRINKIRFFKSCHVQSKMATKSTFQSPVTMAPDGLQSRNLARWRYLTSSIYYTFVNARFFSESAFVSKNVTFWQLSIKCMSVNQSAKADVVIKMEDQYWAIIVRNMKWIALRTKKIRFFKSSKILAYNFSDHHMTSPFTKLLSSKYMLFVAPLFVLSGTLKTLGSINPTIGRGV